MTEQPMSLAAAHNVAEQVRSGAPYGEAPMRRALVTLLDEVVSAALELEQRRALMIEALELGDQGYAGRPWDWDTIASYARKRVGTTRMALATVERRNRAVAAALALPVDTPWPRMVERIVDYRKRVTMGGPTKATDDQWANPILEPPASASDPTAPPLRTMRCPAPPVGCGHMFNRHDPDGQGCHVRIEVNHVNGVAGGFEVCGCTERRPS